MRPICGLRSSFPVRTKALDDHNFPVTSPQSLRLVLLEDDDFTLMTLAALVRSLGHQVVAQTSTIVEAIDCARLNRLDAAILDLDLGVGPTGIDVAHGLRAVSPHLGIVVLSSYAEPRVMGQRARPLPMGSQFLSKQDLGDATILDQALHAAIDLDNAPAPPRRQVPLSDSQLEIMRLVATGLTNDEIAERLWLTESGVKRAITRLLRKLELDGGNPRVQLTRAYYQLTGRAAGDE